MWGETVDPVEVPPCLGTEYHCLLKIQLRRVYRVQTYFQPPAFESKKRDCFEEGCNESFQHQDLSTGGGSQVEEDRGLRTEGVHFDLGNGN